jgi:hypothetical protein
MHSDGTSAAGQVRKAAPSAMEGPAAPGPAQGPRQTRSITTAMPWPPPMQALPTA